MRPPNFLFPSFSLVFTVLIFLQNIETTFETHAYSKTLCQALRHLLKDFLSPEMDKVALKAYQIRVKVRYTLYTLVYL